MIWGQKATETDDEAKKSGRRNKSRRRREFDSDYEAAKPVVKRRSRGQCEIRVAGICKGRASHVHHVGGRKRPDANTPKLLRHTCDACHSYVHAHPLESYANGWLVHSWDQTVPSPSSEVSGGQPIAPGTDGISPPVADNPSVGSGGDPSHAEPGDIDGGHGGDSSLSLESLASHPAGTGSTNPTQEVTS